MQFHHLKSHYAKSLFLDNEVLLVVSKTWFLYVVIVVVVDFSLLQTFHEFYIGYQLKCHTYYFFSL